jgi:V8-like Glu-specific endopeptidase
MLYAQHNNVRTAAQNTHTQAQAPIKIGDEVAVNIQTAHPYNTTNQTGVVFEQEFYNKNSAYIKLYFEDFDLGPKDYVEISTHNTGASILYAAQGKIIDQNGTMISNFWSQALLDERVTVRLHAVGGTNSHSGFKISRVAYGYSEAQIEALSAKSICGNDDKQPIICYNGTTMYQKSRAVCRLLMNGSSLCTGWLLGSEGHIMTNEHCIGNSSTAQNTDFMFNYQATNCSGSGSATSTVVASTSTFIKTNSSLDYTLVKLPVNPTGTYGYLQLSPTAPSVGDRIYIVQHPGGRRKEISVVTDQGGTAQGYSMINTVSTNGARYYADTEGGSSGSPVIDYNSNLVVAIHNTGGCTNGSYGRSDRLISSIGNDMPADGYPGFNGGGGGTPPACNDNEVVLTLVLDNYASETSWTLKNASGATVASGGGYSTNNSTVTETFCLPDGCYDFTINDSYGDGICCTYGNGSYDLSSGGTSLASGGQFASTETKNICVGGSGGGGTTPCPTINLSAQTIKAYGNGQDVGSGSVSNGVLTLANNAWKYIDYNYNVTANTVVEFDFYSTSQGEIQGLGFDTDNGISSNYTFHVYGTQNWGIRNYDNYSTQGTWKSYTIPVGQFYTGSFNRLFFVCDDDANGGGNASFRNVKVYEAGTCESATDLAVTNILHAAEGEFSGEFKLFPNPTNSVLNVQLNATGAVQTRVTDALGRVVSEQIMQDGINQLNVAALPNGIYQLTLIKENGEMITEKFIKG